MLLSKYPIESHVFLTCLNENVGLLDTFCTFEACNTVVGLHGSKPNLVPKGEQLDEMVKFNCLNNYISPGGRMSEEYIHPY